MNSKEIRIDCQNQKAQFPVCKHISINAYKDNGEDGEYVEHLTIRCKLCRKSYKFDIQI